VLCHKANIPLAVVEAKDNLHNIGAGMAQAINYAAPLDVPFSFSSTTALPMLLAPAVP
jgi:type I restriction enzyme, R subunit